MSTPAGMPGDERIVAGISPESKAPFTVTVQGKGRALLTVGGARHELRQGEYTDWAQVAFRVVPGMSVHGVCKFLLLDVE